MRVVIFGATGRTGRLLVEGGLARGHDVTAFVRSPQGLGDLRDHVRVIQGDVLDGGAVSDAVDGRQAALVALAARGGKADSQVNALGALNVIRSMQRYGARRLIVLSSSRTYPGHDPNMPWFAERLVKPLFMRSALADLRRAEVNVRQSELDWTLVRAARLTDDPATGRYQVGPGFSLPGGTRIGRADVAAFMLDQLESTSDIAHAVAIAD